MDSLTLNNQIKIPVLGLGTWLLSGDNAIDVVKKAVNIGYRHIDTAEMYNNENEIGIAIKNFDRNKLFITSIVK